MKHQYVRFAFSAMLGVVVALSVAIAAAQSDVTVALSPVGGSGVTATATLTASGNQTNLSLTAQGLAANSDHAIAIGTGTCPNVVSDAFDLGAHMANASGTLSFTTTVNATLASLQDGNHNVHIHQAAAGTSAIVACGNIPMAAAATMAPTARATASATAVASATPSATTTAAVTVTASPTAIPSAGGIPLPLAPAGALGAAALALGYYLRRRR